MQRIHEVRNIVLATVLTFNPAVDCIYSAFCAWFADIYMSTASNSGRPLKGQMDTSQAQASAVYATPGNMTRDTKPQIHPMCGLSCSVGRQQSSEGLPVLLCCRYRTDFQPKRMLREKQKHLLSHLKQVSGQISEMAANDPWKLIQRAFEYGFLLNGLAQVCRDVCL